jgi:hypothetical protein
VAGSLSFSTLAIASADDEYKDDINVWRCRRAAVVVARAKRPCRRGNCRRQQHPTHRKASESHLQACLSLTLLLAPTFRLLLTLALSQQMNHQTGTNTVQWKQKRGCRRRRIRHPGGDCGWHKRKMRVAAQRHRSPIAKPV